MSLFESVRLGNGSEGNEVVDPTPIEKLMSVPVQNDQGVVLGVIQISRKGLDASAAGPDFTNEELHHLERSAGIIARMPFMTGESTTSATAGS